MQCWTHNLDIETEHAVEVCLAKARQQYKLEQLSDESIDHLLDRINTVESAGGSDSTLLIDAYQCLSGQIPLVLVMFAHRYKIVSTSKYARSDFRRIALHPMVVVTLPVDVGRIQIRRKTIGDRIANLFTRKHVDFRQHWFFSFNYQVTATDKERVQLKFTRAFLDVINKHKDYVIAIQGPDMVVLREQFILPDGGCELLSAGCAMLDALK